MNKRGISVIVASVLLILIAVLATMGIFMNLIPFLSFDLDYEDYESDMEIETSYGYTVWDAENERISIQVTRGQEEGEEPIAMSFVFVVKGTSIEQVVDNLPGKGESEIYFFDLSKYGKPSEIRAILIYEDDTRELVSELMSIPLGDLEKIDKEFIPIGEEECSNSSCDGVCEVTEGCIDAPADCGECSCGDGVCDAEELQNQSCWQDCGYGDCGDGVCGSGENSATCSQDCGHQYNTTIYNNIDDWKT